MKHLGWLFFSFIPIISSGDVLEERFDKLQDLLEERVARLEELVKVGTLRSCNEYAQYGLKTSGMYSIDPDGSLNGKEPFDVICDFDLGSTEVMHNNEKLTDVEHCSGGPGCISYNISYTNGNTKEEVALSQIVSLIDLSEYCEQSIKYTCFLAPLFDDDVYYVTWDDRNGESNSYFTGNGTEGHVCDCHYEEEGCKEEEIKKNTCNCDANVPAELSDTGTITNNDALPVMRLSFGGLNYESQYAKFQLDRLKCFGSKQVDVGISCSALKKKGQMQSGYYNIKPLDDSRPILVYCDMATDTYTNVPQFEELSAVSPLGTILAWVPKPLDSADALELPAGWMFCDGSNITRGPWDGAKTPDLNNEGRFLRGGVEDQALAMEEDMLLDHNHEDAGHIHPCTATTSLDDHTHSFQMAKQGGLTDENDLCGNTDDLCLDPVSLTYEEIFTSESTVSATSECEIGSVLSGLGGVTDGPWKGPETRPINMRVVYVIRVE